MLQRKGPKKSVTQVRHVPSSFAASRLGSQSWSVNLAQACRSCSQVQCASSMPAVTAMRCFTAMSAGHEQMCVFARQPDAGSTGGEGLSSSSGQFDNARNNGDAAAICIVTASAAHNRSRVARTDHTRQCVRKACARSCASRI